MSLQLLIILTYLGLTVCVGYWAKKKTKNSASFHGAGLGIFMCVAASTGQWLGGTSTTGVAEYGYNYGLSGAWYTIANGVGVLVLGLFFAKLYRSLETGTIPGIIGKYFGSKARHGSSLILIFVMVAVGVAQLLAAGSMGQAVLGIRAEWSIIILGICFTVYTLHGGMIAVGYTNIMHLSAMYGGVILALLYCFFSSKFVPDLANRIPVESFNMAVIGYPKISSWLIASVLGACTAQAGIQPLLAAKDIHSAKKAALITVPIVIPFGILTAFLGIIAKLKFPELVNAKLALPQLLMAMPAFIGGIVLATIMAAILSTVSPLILAAGTMFTKDIYLPLKGAEVPEKQIMRISRNSTGIFGALCIVLALLFYGNTAILDIVYFAYTLRGALFVILLLGIFWRKTSSKAALPAIILTALTSVYWLLHKKYTGTYPLHPAFTETYAAVTIAFLVTVVFSFIYRKYPCMTVVINYKS